MVAERQHVKFEVCEEAQYRSDWTLEADCTDTQYLINCPTVSNRPAGQQHFIYSVYTCVWPSVSVWS